MEEFTREVGINHPMTDKTSQSIPDNLWDDSLNQALKRAKQAKAKEAELKKKDKTRYRNFLRKSDWISLTDWIPKKLGKRIRSSKRGI